MLKMYFTRFFSKCLLLENYDIIILFLSWKGYSRKMGIAETLEYIHSVRWQGSKPGLERTQGLLNALGNPEKQLKFVHVAGTNGKGSR